MGLAGMASAFMLVARPRLKGTPENLRQSHGRNLGVRWQSEERAPTPPSEGRMPETLHVSRPRFPPKAAWRLRFPPHSKVPLGFPGVGSSPLVSERRGYVTQTRVFQNRPRRTVRATGARRETRRVSACAAGDLLWAHRELADAHWDSADAHRESAGARRELADARLARRAVRRAHRDAAGGTRAQVRISGRERASHKPDRGLPADTDGGDSNNRAQQRGAGAEAAGSR